MSDIQGIRLKNANDILRTLCEGKIKIFAEQIDRTASYVSTYISGKDPKPISDKVAHTIEVAFSLPSGRLDDNAPLFENKPNSNIEATPPQVIPKSLGFSLSMFPEIQAGIAVREHVNNFINKSNLESHIPVHFNKIGAMNFISDMMKKTAMELEILARDIRLDVMIDSMKNLQEELETLGLHIESQNVTAADSNRSRLCRTILVTDQWSNKKYLVTIAGLKFGFIGRTLTQEYEALRNSDIIASEINKAFTIILREEEDVIGGLIPFVFENTELSDFNIFNMNENSQAANNTINFSDTLRFVTEGLLEIKNVKVLIGKTPKQLEVTLTSKGTPHPLKTLVKSVGNEISDTENIESEIISLSGSLFRKDIKTDLAINSIAYAYGKITGTNK
ncbi:MAG: hypothetical protein ABJK37_05465 [Paraglaciecola sp.]|uniref:hypothetical protein n=1 Tax=Paraglaciecola sp. TaxID=1920173 RepID=UPI003297FBB1